LRVVCGGRARSCRHRALLLLSLLHFLQLALGLKACCRGKKVFLRTRRSCDAAQRAMGASSSSAAAAAAAAVLWKRLAPTLLLLLLCLLLPLKLLLPPLLLLLLNITQERHSPLRPNITY
jgi:hypothetical protein